MVGDADIGFVSDGRDDGDVAGEDGSGDRLFVVGPEVFGRAAAAGDDNHVGFVVGQEVESLDGFGDGLGGSSPLREAGREEERGQRPATGQDLLDIVPDRAAGRGDDSDAAGIGRERPLALGIEEALLAEIAEESLELGLEDTFAERAEVVDDDLQRASSEVEIGAAVDEDLIALLNGHASVFAAEEDAGQCYIGFGVGEVEVVVTCAGAIEAADLALDPDVVELRIGFELGADVSGDFADRSGLGGWRGLFGGLGRWIVPVDALLLGSADVEAGGWAFGHGWCWRAAPSAASRHLPKGGGLWVLRRVRGIGRNGCRL